MDEVIKTPWSESSPYEVMSSTAKGFRWQNKIALAPQTLCRSIQLHQDLCSLPLPWCV